MEILTTMDEDPHVVFFPWEMEVQDIAAGMAKSIHPNGLLSTVLTDEQWAAYPGNTTVDQNGQPQVVARYQPPAYVDIDDTMSNTALYVAKASNDRLQTWIDATETLKRALIKSLGKVVRQIIKDKKVRFQQMSVSDLVTKVRTRFGNMQRDTQLTLTERMATLLPTLDGFDTHVSNLQDMYDISENAGYPVDAKRQVEIFRESVCAQPLVGKLLETFDLKFPDAKTVSFEQVTAYLTLHLPNLKHSQMTATRASANLLAATAYSTLEAESKRLTAENEKLKRKRAANDKRSKKGKKGQGKGKGARNAASGARTGDTATLKYCHGHGYQPSHTSAECKLLAADKAKFTAAMRAATGPNNPPGGSTKVNGQHASTTKTKTVTANIAHQIHNHREGDEYDMSDNEDDYDETTAFLTSVLNEAQHDEDNDAQHDEDDRPVHVTAMMMGDDALLFNQSNIPRKAHTLNREKMTADELNDQEDIAEVNELNNETNLPRTTETNAAPFETSFPPDAADRNLGAMEGSNETPYEPPRATDADSNLRVMEGSNKTPYEPPSHVAKMDHDEAPTYTLLTDGSQFQQSFWETEVQSLQDGLRRNFAGKANTPSRRIPTADELQIQFVTWLLEQPEVPLLVSPASSGFYEATYGNRPTPTAGTGFFDDEYVAGKRQHTISRDRQRNTLNPGLRTELTYQEACTAELTTIASVEHHERRLFQPGFTPTEIRGNILSMLQTANPDQHMVDFQEKDIPPQNRDPKTHRILMDLIRKRRQLDLDFQLPPHSVAVDGTSLHDKRQYEQELIRRDREYNRVNRGMYHVYAASAYIVHDCNFLSYCRPALRNLPIATAYKLAQLKERLVTPNSGHPPYQTIQEPTRVQTQPTFSAPRPSYADVLRPALHPREEWMKSQPPY